MRGLGLEHPPNPVCAPSPRITAFSYTGMTYPAKSNSCSRAFGETSPDQEVSDSSFLCCSHPLVFFTHLFSSPCDTPGWRDKVLKGRGALPSQACTAPCLQQRHVSGEEAVSAPSQPATTKHCWLLLLPTRALSELTTLLASTWVSLCQYLA